MKKVIKIMPILLVLLFAFLVFAPDVFAAPLTPNDVGANATAQDTTKDIGGVVTIAGKILSIIRNIAAIVAVIIIAVLGIKFMLGSAEERAEYKKSFVPLIIGVVVVLGAVQIATMLFSLNPNP